MGFLEFHDMWVSWNFMIWVSWNFMIWVSWNFMICGFPGIS